jgi:hypothetical protein
MPKSPAPATKAKAPATTLKPQPAVPREPMLFNLGDILRCRLTSATGIAVGYTEYLYGCRRWNLQIGETTNGKPAEWIAFDEPQLERVATASSTATPARVTGGPRPDMAARHTPSHR